MMSAIDDLLNYRMTKSWSEWMKTLDASSAELADLRAQVEAQKDNDKYCPLCTWRGPVELDNGVCPQCGINWPKAYREYQDALTVARERIAAQARQLREARKFAQYVCDNETSVEPIYIRARAWLAANPAPVAAGAAGDVVERRNG